MTLVATVWDRFDYGRDVQWYKTVGYPMMKGIAEFWLDLLVEDQYFKDGKLVANPCNSPEQGPTVSFHTPRESFILDTLWDFNMMRSQRLSAAPSFSKSYGSSSITSFEIGTHRAILTGVSSNVSRKPLLSSMTASMLANGGKFKVHYITATRVHLRS